MNLLSPPYPQSGNVIFAPYLALLRGTTCLADGRQRADGRRLEKYKIRFRAQVELGNKTCFYVIVPFCQGMERRQFSGPTGWLISYNDTLLRWTISNPTDESSFAFFEGEDLTPMGKRLWKISSSVCNRGLDEERELLLSSCSSGQFTCTNGVCVDIVHRCDGVKQCKDQSDEENCKLVKFDRKKYLKDKPPTSESILPVELSSNVEVILDIDEVSSHIYLTVSAKPPKMKKIETKVFSFLSLRHFRFFFCG